ncbi:MAG: TonB-dependent receptor, partial [Bacteroidales bacterium]|nr:TonB-dependent receptor [Bacteroidales bacterium]
TVYGYGAAGRDLLSYPALRLGHLCLDETTPNNILKNATACATVHSITETGEPLGTEASDLWVKKADYFRLSDIQLGYSFGDKVLKALKMSGMRLYLAVQNVALASPYKTCGDPETFNGNAALNSVDLGSYARPRTYMAGLNITF